MKSSQKKKFDFIFVIVTYRNAEDLFELDESLRKFVNNYKVIIVNNYMNDETEKRIKEIASLLKYDYIKSENRGYGAGNNKGIDYAINNYKFDYLVVSNSDVVIKKFDIINLPKNKAIIGPKITTLNGKLQNPYWVKENKIAQKFIYLGLKNKSKVRLNIGQGFNKIIREVFLLFNKNKSNPIKTYAIHGAFVIFTEDVIRKLHPIYDENMFLYYEEALLAKKSKIKKINRYFFPNIQILHKEDGSTKGSNISLNGYARNSFIYYYEQYYKKGS